MMVTCHSNTLLSSTKPAEKPSTGFRVNSVGSIHATPSALSKKFYFIAIYPSAVTTDAHS